MSANKNKDGIMKRAKDAIRQQYENAKMSIRKHPFPFL